MKSKILIFSLIILVLFSVSAVTAADADDTSIASDDSQIDLAATNDLEIAEAGGDDVSADANLAQANDADDKLGDDNITKTAILAIENETFSRPLVSEGLGYYPIFLLAEDESPIADKNITVNFAGASEDFQTNSLGLVNYFIPNATVTGTYAIDIAFAGDADYEASTFSTNIEVHDVETQIDAPVDISYPRPLVIEELAYYPIFLGTNTTIPLPLGNRNITVNIGGVEEEYTTNELGIVNVVVYPYLNKGNLTVQISYAGEDGYKPVTFTTNMEIYDVPTQIEAMGNISVPLPVGYENVTYYPFALTTDTFIPIPMANRTVKVSFAGLDEEFTTGMLGIVNYNALPYFGAGNYTLNIHFDGEDGYLPCDYAANIEFYEVETEIDSLGNLSYPAPLIVEGLGYYPIILVTNDAVIPIPLENRTVTISFNGKTEEYVTDSLGIVYYLIDNETEEGNYTIVVKYAGEDGFLPATLVKDIEIYNVETQVISLGNETYPRPVVSHEHGFYPIMLATDSIIPIPLANRTVEILFDGGDYEYQTNEFGIVNFVLPADTDAGNYSIGVFYLGDGGYDPCYVVYNIEVIDIETQLLSLGNETYPRPVVSHEHGFYPILLVSDSAIPLPLENKSIAIDFNGNFVEYQTNEFGIVTYVLPDDTPAGNYTIYVRFAGDDDFIGSTLEANIEVVSVETQILSFGNETYPAPVVLKENGYYPIMLVSDSAIPIPLENATVVIDFDGIYDTYQTNALGIVNYVIPADTPAGNYTIAVAYLGDDDFDGSVLVANIEIVDVETQIHAIGNASIPYPVVVDGDAHYPFMLTSDALIDFPISNQTVVVDFGGVFGQYTTNFLGIVDYIVPSELTPGNYTVVISYAGADGFVGCDYTTNVEIFEVDTQIIALESITYSHPLVDAGLAYYPIELTTNTTIPIPLAGKKVYIDFNGFSYEYTTNALGLINFFIPDAPEGEYAIEITFAGDETYPAAEFTGYIEIVDEGTKIYGPHEVSFDYSEVADGEADYTFFLTTDDLIPLPVIGAEVYIAIGDHADFYTTNLLGMITYTLPDDLAADEYTLYITYLGDHGFEPTSAEVSVKINKEESTLTVKDMIFDCGSSGITTATYTGATGVTASVEGQPGAVVAVSGNIIVVSNLNAGVYTLKVTTIPDAGHTAVTETAAIVVNKGSTQIAASAVTTTYHVNKNLVITLKDASGNAISGAKLTVNLNGEKTYTTDSNGQVKISTKNLAPKTYTAKITFNGNSNYKASSKSVKVTVKKATPVLTAKAKTFKVAIKTKKYSITLKEKTGTAIKKAKVFLKVGKYTFKATTNAKGQATFKITKLTTKGKFTANVIYKGNGYYNKVTKKVVLTVA